jgi:hypothetical protein
MLVIATNAYNSNFFDNKLVMVQQVLMVQTFRSNAGLFCNRCFDLSNVLDCWTIYDKCLCFKFHGNQAGYQQQVLITHFFGIGAGRQAQVLVIQISLVIMLVCATFANRSNFIGQNAGNVATNADNSNFIGREAGTKQQMHMGQIWVIKLVSSNKCFNSNFMGKCWL